MLSKPDTCTNISLKGPNQCDARAAGRPTCTAAGPSLSHQQFVILRLAQAHASLEGFGFRSLQSLSQSELSATLQSADQQSRWQSAPAMYAAGVAGSLLVLDWLCDNRFSASIASCEPSQEVCNFASTESLHQEISCMLQSMRKITVKCGLAIHPHPIARHTEGSVFRGSRCTSYCQVDQQQVPGCIPYLHGHVCIGAIFLSHAA